MRTLDQLIYVLLALLKLCLVGFVALLHLLSELVFLSKTLNAVQKFGNLAFESFNFVLESLIGLVRLVEIVALSYAFRA